MGMGLAVIPDHEAYEAFIASSMPYGWIGAHRFDNIYTNPYSRFIWWTTNDGNDTAIAPNRHNGLAFYYRIYEDREEWVDQKFAGFVEWCEDSVLDPADTGNKYAQYIKGDTRNNSSPIMTNGLNQTQQQRPCARTATATDTNQYFWCSYSVCTNLRNCNGNARNVTGTYPNCKCECDTNFAGPTCLIPSSPSSPQITNGYEVYAVAGPLVTMPYNMADMLVFCTNQHPSLYPFPIEEIPMLEDVRGLVAGARQKLSTASSNTSFGCAIDGYLVTGSDSVGNYKRTFGRRKGEYMPQLLPSSIVVTPNVSRKTNLIIDINNLVNNVFHFSTFQCVMCARAPCVVTDCPKAAGGAAAVKASGFFPTCACTYGHSFDEITQYMQTEPLTWEEAAVKCSETTPTPSFLATVRNYQQWNLIKSIHNSLPCVVWHPGGGRGVEGRLQEHPRPIRRHHLL